MSDDPVLSSPSGSGPLPGESDPSAPLLPGSGHTPPIPAPSPAPDPSPDEPPVIPDEADAEPPA